MNMRFGLGILAYVVPTFALGFTAVQWIMVGPLTALAFAGSTRTANVPELIGIDNPGTGE